MVIAILFEVDAYLGGSPSFPNGLDGNIVVGLSFCKQF